MTAQSELYRAKDKSSGEQVALKLIRPRFLAGEQFGARLEQEFKVLQMLQHPNVVRVLNCGRTKENLVYFVMEYVPGKTLGTLLKSESTWSPERLADFLDQVASALDYAHDQHIIHRDINPDSFMIRKEANGQELVKVIDFGLAKVLDVEPENALVQTGAAVVKGSPAYMSPEQAGGKAVNKLTDIYSLGVLMYRMLTGTVPFEGRNEIDTIVSHVKKPVPRFVERNPDCRVPESMEAVVTKALSKKASDRQASVTELAREFRRAVSLAGPASSIPAQVTRVAGPNTDPASYAPTRPQGSGPMLTPKSEVRRSRPATEMATQRQKSDNWMLFAIFGLGVLIIAGLLFVIVGR